MIRISRPNKSPKILKTKGEARTAEDCAAYDAEPAAYRSGKKSFSSDRKIYNSKGVKSGLMKAQHGKCCFCEKKITNYGDIEHFRPKGGVRQNLYSSIEPLGYYWLAYTWTNLLVSCSSCNRTHKGIQFPLRKMNQRAHTHHDPIENEEPMLVDPASEDPRTHIHFRYDAPEAKTPRGKVTIEVLGLDNWPPLTEERLEFVKFLHFCCLVLKSDTEMWDDELIDIARNFIEQSTKKESKFSSMAIDFVEKEME